MKKILLATLTALATLSAGAQEFSSYDSDENFDFVPAIFTCNGETIIIGRSEDDTYTILNGEQKGKSFYGMSTCWSGNCCYYDWDNLYESRHFFFTQNLFNDDEHIEWIYRGAIHSSNGTQTALPFVPEYETYIFKINNKHYIVGNNEESGCSLYLIKRETASIEKVPADAPEARLVYSLSGRRQNDMQQGVNIIMGGENGPRKVLKR